MCCFFFRLTNTLARPLAGSNSQMFYILLLVGFNKPFKATKVLASNLEMYKRYTRTSQQTVLTAKAKL